MSDTANLCIDDPGNSTVNGTKLVLEDCLHAGINPPRRPPLWRAERAVADHSRPCHRHWVSLAAICAVKDTQ